MKYLFDLQLVVYDIYSLNNHKENLMVYQKLIKPLFFLILFSYLNDLQQIPINVFEHMLKLYQLNLNELIQLNVVAKNKFKIKKTKK